MTRRLLRTSAFRGLRWKLTITYTLVTVAFLLGAEMVFLGLSLVFTSHVFSLPAARVIVRNIAPQARYFLERRPPDVEGLTLWLQEGAQLGFVVASEGTQFHRFTPVSLFFCDWQLLVFDREAQLLAMIPPEPDGSDNSLEAPGDVPGLERLWPVALSGVTSPVRLFSHTPEGHVTIAAPIRAKDGGTLGVLVATGSATKSAYPSLVDLAMVLSRSLVVFTATAGLIGLGFGFLTARGLSGRLGDLAGAASAWSRGDFGVLVQDDSDDEIGELGRQLNDMATQLRRLLHTRQQLAMLEERNRLARDLHDSVKQEAFALSAQLSAARALLHRDPAAAEARLGEAENLADQIRMELSGLIQELRPLDLRRRGLVAALREYVDDWSRLYRIHAHVTAPDDVPLPPSAEQALYRVAQEALSNAARHSQATAAEVRVRVEDNLVTLVIRDNGRGFDVDGARDVGVGLRSMRERVEPLGEFEVQSRPGRGTTVRATFNIPEGEQAQEEGVG